MKTFSSLCITNTHLNERSKKRKYHTPTSEAMLRKKKRKGPASLFGREAEGEGWSVKKKKLFERSEFFFFSGIPDRSSPKSADGEFSLFRFFCSGKRNEKPSRLERERSDKALAALEQKAQRQLSEKTFFLQNFFFQEKEKAPP